MKNRDPLPLLLAAFFVLMLFDEPYPALAVVALWFLGAMGDVERAEAALKRGDLHEWVQLEPR